jgi:CRP-like cAMP-binding protein
MGGPVTRSEQRLGEEDRTLLSAHRILCDLSDGLRTELIGKFHVEDVDAGVHLLEEGQTNSRLFFVLKGAVSVKLPKQAGRVSEVKLATLGAGEIFGEYSLFDAQPVSAAVYAAEPTRLAWLEKADLDVFVDSHREVNHRFEGLLGNPNNSRDVTEIGGLIYIYKRPNIGESHCHSFTNLK